MNRSDNTSRFIVAPPRSSFMDASTVVVVFIILSAALIMSGIEGKLTHALLLAGLLALAIIRRAIYAVHAALFAFLWILLVTFVPIFQVWPLNIFVPLVVYGAAASIVPQLRHSVGWIHRGSISPEVIKLIIAIVFIATLALVGWVVLIKPDIEHYISLVPQLPFWAYPFAGIGFAIFNAAIEEAIFRGVIMEALDSALGAGHLSVGIQAIPFAAFHYLAGFPNGMLGCAMVLVYGIMLGIVRRQSKGMLAPFVSHIAADVTIFTILVIIIFRYNNAIIA